MPIEVRKKAKEEDVEGLVEVRAKARTDAAKKKADELLDQAEKELEYILEEEKILEGIKKNWEAAMQEVARFEAWCAAWVDKLEKASYTDKRTCLEYLGVEVVVYKFGSRPRFTITASPKTIMEKLKYGEIKLEVVSTQSKS